jgi:hypothetical protein
MSYTDRVKLQECCGADLDSSVLWAANASATYVAVALTGSWNSNGCAGYAYAFNEATTATPASDEGCSTMCVDKQDQKCGCADDGTTHACPDGAGENRFIVYKNPGGPMPTPPTPSPGPGEECEE